MKAEEHSPAPIFTCQEKRGKRAKRFSDEQIKSLESIFKLETKLEPSTKLQLAKDLGLQPRQVAIWFQNKRARWKSKQIEEDYRELQANFDSLSMEFESLKQENQSLLTQFEMLRSPNGEHSRRKDSEENGTNNGPYKFKEEPSGLSEGLDHHEIMYEDHNEAALLKNIEQKEETETLRFDEYGHSSLASPENLCGLFSQSCETSKWWDF